MTYNIVLMTTSNKKEAQTIVHALLEERLISCANIIDTVSSVFCWKGTIQEEDETLVIMKSHEKHFKKIADRVQKLHSYDVPEILSLPIVDGSQSYLDWIKACIQPVN